VDENKTLQIRGAYFAGSKTEGKAALDFFVLDPNKRVIYSRRKWSEGIFSINATKTGQYAFIFSNLKVFPACITIFIFNRAAKINF
jgi:hypothetical protein